MVTLSRDSLTIGLCAVVALGQISWISYHVRFVNKYTLTENVPGHTPDPILEGFKKDTLTVEQVREMGYAAVFKRKPWAEHEWPSCEADSVWGYFKLVFGPDGWLVYLVIFPFTLTEQGEWQDYPNEEIYQALPKGEIKAAVKEKMRKNRGFARIYSPFFDSFSGKGWLPLCHGATVILSECLTVWIIGTTIRGEIRDESTQRRDAGPQLVALFGIRMLLVLLLLVQWPYLDYLDSGMEALVTLEQGIFFLILYLYPPSSASNQTEMGGMLNYLNLAVLGCLMINSFRGPAMLLRQSVEGCVDWCKGAVHHRYGSERLSEEHTDQRVTTETEMEDLSAIISLSSIPGLAPGRLGSMELSTNTASTPKARDVTVNPAAGLFSDSIQIEMADRSWGSFVPGAVTRGPNRGSMGYSTTERESDRDSFDTLSSKTDRASEDDLKYSTSMDDKNSPVPIYQEGGPQAAMAEIKASPSPDAQVERSTTIDVSGLGIEPIEYRTTDRDRGSLTEIEDLRGTTEAVVAMDHRDTVNTFTMETTEDQEGSVTDLRATNATERGSLTEIEDMRATNASSDADGWPEADGGSGHAV